MLNFGLWIGYFTLIGNYTTCDPKNTLTTQTLPQEECFEICRATVNCQYVTHTGTECLFWADCFPVSGVRPLFQDPNSCGTDNVVQSHVSFMDSTSFAHGVVHLHLQFPSELMVQGLDFRDATDDYGSYSQDNPHWTNISVGCITVLHGEFPIKTMYNPSIQVNRFGFTLTGNILHSNLQSYFAYYTTFGNTLFEQTLNYDMPWSIELAETVQTTIELIVEKEFVQTLDGLAGPCEDAVELVQEASEAVLDQFGTPLSVEVTTDCGNWGGRRSLGARHFHTKATSHSSNPIDITADSYIYLMGLELPSGVTVTGMSDVVCSGCDDVINNVQITSHEVVHDRVAMITSITIHASSSPSAGWSLRYNNNLFSVTSSAEIQDSSFFLHSVCWTDDPCTQTWTVNIVVNSVYNASAKYSLHLPAVRATATQEEEVKVVEYKFSVEELDPAITQVEEASEVSMKAESQNVLYQNVDIPENNFYIGDTIRFAFGLPEPYQQFNVDSLTILYLGSTIVLEGESVDFQTRDQILAADFSILNSELTWSIFLDNKIFTTNGTILVRINGDLVHGNDSAAFQYAKELLLLPFHCITQSGVPILLSHYVYAECPDSERNYFVECTSAGWLPPEPHDSLCEVIVGTPSAQSSQTKTRGAPGWVTITVICMCSVLILVIVALAINYKCFRTRPQAYIGKDPAPSRRDIEMTTSYGRSRLRNIHQTNQEDYSQNPLHPKRVPRWRQETSVGGVHQLQVTPPQEDAVEGPADGGSARKRQLWKLLSSIERQLQRSDAIEKVEIKLKPMNMRVPMVHKRDPRDVSRSRTPQEDSEFDSNQSFQTRQHYRRRTPSANTESVPIANLLASQESSPAPVIVVKSRFPGVLEDRMRGTQSPSIDSHHSSSSSSQYFSNGVKQRTIANLRDNLSSSPVLVPPKSRRPQVESDGRDSPSVESQAFKNRRMGIHSIKHCRREPLGVNDDYTFVDPRFHRVPVTTHHNGFDLATLIE